MSYYCTNPEVYSGDPGDPPEFESDCPFQCFKCCEEFDWEDEDRFEVNGEDVCWGCMTCCALCGEFLDDKSFPKGVVVINFRDWETNGKLSRDHCPKCAGEWIISQIIGGDDEVDTDELSREAISDLLMQAQQ